MGKSSQRKGADGERELATILREHGYDIERGGSQTYGEVPDLMGLPGVHIEVKRRSQLVPPALPLPMAGHYAAHRLAGAVRESQYKAIEQHPSVARVYPVRCRSRTL